MGEWDPEDDPTREHRNLFPHCPLMRGDPCGNITAEDEELGGGENVAGSRPESARERRFFERVRRENRVRENKLG